MKNYQIMYTFNTEDVYVIFLNAEDVLHAITDGLGAIQGEYDGAVSTLMGFSVLERFSQRGDNN